MSQPMSEMDRVRARYQNNPDAAAYRERDRARRQNGNNGQAQPQRQPQRRIPAQQQPRTVSAPPRDISREVTHEEAQQRAGMTDAQLKAVADALVHVPDRRTRRVQPVPLTDKERYADATPQEKREAWERGEAPYGIRQDGTAARPPGRPQLPMLQELEDNDPADLDLEGIQYEENPEDEYEEEPAYVQPEPIRPPVRQPRQERPVQQQQRTTRRNPEPQRRNPGTTATITISAPKALADALFDLIANVGFGGVTPDHITGGAYLNHNDDWEVAMQEDRRTPGNVNVRYINLIYDNF